MLVQKIVGKQLEVVNEEEMEEELVKAKNSMTKEEVISFLDDKLLDHE